MTDMKNTVASPGLLRIQEVADRIGTTPRAIRYWEEMGLLRPAARSEGDYRLYDETDVERLRFIKGLRDDAGFSLAEVALMLEDEVARERSRAAYHAATDPEERLRIQRERLSRLDKQIALLRTKIERLQSMADASSERRERALSSIADLEREVDVASNGDPAT